MNEKENVRNPVSAQQRLKVLVRDRFTCTYCGAIGPETELEVDHIHPVSKGGSNHISNLTTACKPCNLKKRDSVGMTPKSFNDPLVGTWLHVFDGSDGREPVYQGEIKFVRDSTVFVTLFSWLDGSPSRLKSFALDFILSDLVTLYPDNQTMRMAYYDLVDASPSDREFAEKIRKTLLS